MTYPSDADLYGQAVNVRLLPCPFCGKKNTVVLVDSNTFRSLLPWEEEDEGYLVYWAVMCDAAKPGGKGGCGASGGFAPDEQKAIARWNRRASNVEVRGASGIAAKRPT